MRGLLVLVAVTGLGGTLGASSVEIPSWLALLIPLVTGGGWLVFYTASVEKRLKASLGTKTEAEAEEVYQRVAERAGAQLISMQNDLDAAREMAKLARSEAQRVAAERDAIVQRLEKRIRDLEEELATTRAQMGLHERRHEGPSEQPFKA